MKKQLLRLLIRWGVNSLGIWLAAELFTDVRLDEGVGPVIGAGLVLALVNAILKPTLILLSLPAILLTLGLFIIVINGLTVLIADKLYSGISIEGFGSAILAGLVIGLVNYLVTIILEGWGKRNNE